MIFYSIFLFGLNLVCITAFPADSATERRENTTNVRFYCISNSSDGEYKLTRMNDNDLSKNVDLTKGFAFYVHGWLSKFDFENEDKITYKIGLAWVDAEDTNFCGVDWRELAKDGYYDASQKHVKHVGTQLALFIKELYDRKVKMDSISIAGHSLGAHVAGFAGKIIHELTNHKISTIFGLDPAGPLFTSMLLHSDFKLTKDNANFVQVLHTSSGSFGTTEMLGHADFIANDGSFQDKCVKKVLKAKALRCSHSHANEIFLSSFMNKCTGIVGEKEEESSSLFSKIKNFFFRSKRDVTAVGTMDTYGIHNKGIPGIFKLKTTKLQPYCVKA